MSFGDIGLSDKDWLEYRLLKVDESVKSINPKDLPSDFCPKACRLVEEFHRKTVNQDIEWMLYFDYKTGEGIYCWKGEEGKTGGLFNDIHFKGKHISSIHNHPKKFYSFPSLDNFEILEKDFEDYEVICSSFSFWIIGFNGILERDEIEKIRYNFNKEFVEINKEVISNFNGKDVGMIIDNRFSDYLSNYLNNSFENIIISKKEYS